MGHPISFWSRFIRSTLFSASETTLRIKTFCDRIGFWGFYAFFFFKFRFRLGLDLGWCVDWIDGASDFILVLLECDDSNEISLLLMFSSLRSWIIQCYRWILISKPIEPSTSTSDLFHSFETLQWQSKRLSEMYLDFPDTHEPLKCSKPLEYDQ